MPEDSGREFKVNHGFYAEVEVEPEEDGGEVTTKRVFFGPARAGVIGALLSDEQIEEHIAASNIEEVVTVTPVEEE